MSETGIVLESGWTICYSDGSIIVSKPGVGGYVAREEGRSGIAESILYYLAADLIRTMGDKNSERGAS